MENVSRIADASVRIRREKLRLGAIYGLAGGLALAIGIWGLDAWMLAQVGEPAAWLKLIAGGPLVILIGGLAGWLTARRDSALWGGLIWLAAALLCVALAAVIPFQALSALVGAANPEFAGLNVYPFAESVKSRMVLLMIFSGGLMAVIGALELMVLDGLIQAYGPGGRLVRLVFSMALFMAAGLLIDGLINQPLRRPLLAIDGLIQMGLEVEAHPELREQRRSAGLTALRPFGDLIKTPRHLTLGTYDSESLVETSAYINFEGVWSTCFVVEDSPMFCNLSSDRYARRLACLIASDGEKACQAQLLPGAKESLQAAAAQLAGKTLKYGILNQRGSAVLVMVQPEGSQEQYQCVMRENGDVLLESCEPTAGKTFVAVDPEAARQAAVPTNPEPAAETETPAETRPAAAPAVTPPAAEGEAVTWPVEGDPAAAMIPAAQPDLAALPQVSKYAIDLSIDPELVSFSGRLVVDYTNPEDAALNELYFRLLPNGRKSYGSGELSVMEASIDGQPANTQLSENDTVLRVALPQSLEPGGQARVEMDFAGRVPEDFGGSETPAGYGIYNLSDGVLALSGWYPILAVYDEDGWNLDPVSAIGDSVYSDTALFTVRICAPADVLVAATGVSTGDEKNPENTCTLVESGPVRDFFIAASRDFVVSSASVDGATVNSYYLPGHESAGQQALEISVESLRIYNEKFGAYPFVELDVIDAPMRNALGVEYPGIILVAQSLYDTPERPEFTVATSHEVAHQWWYSVIGNDVFEEPWLDEALTSFSSSLYYEYGESLGAAQGLWSFWQGSYDRLLSSGRDDIVTESLAYFEADPERPYGTVVYTKGALFFRALREEIGDEAFFAALQQYYREHKYGIARGSDLLAAFEAAAGRDLKDFYQRWLFSK